MYLSAVADVVQAGGGVHGVQEVASRSTAEDQRLLRASVSRQNVRREANSRRGQRMSQRGLTLTFDLLTFAVVELFRIVVVVVNVQKFAAQSRTGALQS